MSMSFGSSSWLSTAWAVHRYRRYELPDSQAWVALNVHAAIATQLRERSVSVIASDVPAEMTLAEYQKSRRCPHVRREGVRVGVFGAPRRLTAGSVQFFRGLR
jgi:hypothetical protein